MIFRGFNQFGKVLVLCVGLCLLPQLRADTTYNIANFVAAPISFTTIFGSTGETFQVTYQATNITASTLTNLYFFAGRVFVNGTEATLVSPGSYQLSNPALDTQAGNPAVFITPSQTNAFFDSASAGSPTIPEIPGFFVTSSLAPSQTTNFIVDFQAPSAVANVRFDGIPTAAVATTPEPSAFVLLGTGIVGLAGAVKRRCC